MLNLQPSVFFRLAARLASRSRSAVPAGTDTGSAVCSVLSYAPMLDVSPFFFSFSVYQEATSWTTFTGCCTISSRYGSGLKRWPAFRSDLLSYNTLDPGYEREQTIEEIAEKLIKSEHLSLALFCGVV